MQILRSYIHHNGQFGAVITVQCDTDFVARNAEFKQFCDNLAMGIASLKDAYVPSILYEENPVTGKLFMVDVLEAREKFGEDIRLLSHQPFATWEHEEVEAVPITPLSVIGEPEEF